MKRLINIWRNFWGRKYKIIYSDKLKENEVLIYRHKIFIKKGSRNEKIK